MMKVDKKEIVLAETGLQLLEAKTGEMEVIFHGKHHTNVTLPKAAVRVLTDALAYISKGQDVVVRPLDEEISTQRAAEFLNVSRPFLIKILEGGEIPFRKVGKHRRVLLSDLQTFKLRIDNKRLKVLKELAAEAQEFGMGY